MHPAAVKSIRMIDQAFCKEVIDTSGFQAVSMYGQEYSWAPVMQKIFADHLAARDLDKTIFANETVVEMMKHHKPTTWFDHERRDVHEETGEVCIEAIFERETGGVTHPVHFKLVNVRRSNELKPLMR